MLWEKLESFLDIRETLLKLAPLVEQIPNVVHWLEQKIRDACSLLEVAPRLLSIALSELQNPQIIERLCMVRIMADCNLKRLKGKPQIPHTDAYMPYIIPHFSNRAIIVKLKRPLEARKRHVILGRIVATKPHVVP